MYLKTLKNPRIYFFLKTYIYEKRKREIHTTICNTVQEPRNQHKEFLANTKLKTVTIKIIQRYNLKRQQ